MSRKRIILATVVFVTSFLMSQNAYYNPGERPIQPPLRSDEEQIRSMLSEVVWAIRNGRVVRAVRPFPEGIDLPARAKGKTKRILSSLFSIDSISIHIADNRAFVRCELNDGWNLKAAKELLTLRRSKGFWKIEESALLTDLLADHILYYARTRGPKTIALLLLEKMIPIGTHRQRIPGM